MRDVGSVLLVFGWAWRRVWVGYGQKQEGRPLLWETHEVCKVPHQFSSAFYSSEIVKEYYVQRVQGGVGLIVT